MFCQIFGRGTPIAQSYTCLLAAHSLFVIVIALFKVSKVLRTEEWIMDSNFPFCLTQIRQLDLVLKSKMLSCVSFLFHITYCEQ